MDDKLYWYWLACLNEFTASGINELMKYFKHPKNLFNASDKDVLNYFNNSNNKNNPKKAEKILAFRKQENIIRSYNKMCTSGIHFITVYEDGYPERLKNINEAPYWIFYKGELPEEGIPSIAIVGARVCSAYGKEMAMRFAKELSDAGIIIISGMASGIDGYAHKGALNAGRKTYAIMGNGVNICYPQENIELYQRIIRNGGILSEYAPGILGKPFHFPMRNRIISGMSDGILVIEARERSGSLITADYGLEQGKDIYAIPGRISDKLSEGCLNLIYQGAKPVRNINDIIEELCIKFNIQMKNNCTHTSHIESNNDNEMQYGNIKQDKVEYSKKSNKNDKQKLNNEESKKINNNLLETEEKIVYANLGLIPKHIETLLEETALPVDNLLALLLQLELKNLAIQPAKNYYSLNHNDM